MKGSGPGPGPGPGSCLGCCSSLARLCGLQDHILAWFIPGYYSDAPAVFCGLEANVKPSVQTDSCLFVLVCLYLFVLEPSVVAEFGRIALELLKRGTSTKMYEGAASKTDQQHNHQTHRLSFLLTYSSWNNLPTGGRLLLAAVITCLLAAGYYRQQ